MTDSLKLCLWWLTDDLLQHHLALVTDTSVAQSQPESSTLLVQHSREVGFLNHSSESVSDSAPSHFTDLCWGALLFLPGVLKGMHGVVSDCAFLFQVSPHSEGVHSSWGLVCVFLLLLAHLFASCLCHSFLLSPSRLINAGRWIHEGLIIRNNQYFIYYTWNSYANEINKACVNVSVA